MVKLSQVPLPPFQPRIFFEKYIIVIFHFYYDSFTDSTLFSEPVHANSPSFSSYPLSSLSSSPSQTKLMGSPTKPSIKKSSPLKIKATNNNKKNSIKSSEMVDQPAVQQTANSILPASLPKELYANESQKEIRIFISSPFKDMSSGNLFIVILVYHVLIIIIEREILVKRVIPQLKRTCAERDVVLNYVDFRCYFCLYLALIKVINIS